MSFDGQRLLSLLPAVLGLRDRAMAVVTPGWLDPVSREDLLKLQGKLDDGLALTPDEEGQLARLRERALAGPLASLLAVLAEQVEVLEEDLEQLYDDQFIETCAGWTVPYIGDLIGYRNPYNGSETVGRTRAEVAHTVALRRRKGTLAVLEQLALDVTGWPASAAEFFQRLITTQYMNHVRPHVAAAPDLRRWEPLERVGTAFDAMPRTLDVRRIESRRGRHNIPNIGLFVWRLSAFPLTKSPAVKVDTRRWRFHPLGIDQALFTRPETETALTQLAGPQHVPIPLARRVLKERLAACYSGDDQRQRSLRVHWDRDDGAGMQPVPLAQVRVCHLGDDGAGWAHLPPAGEVAVDPALGRLALPPEATAAWRVWVDFHYGFPAELGGGPYERAASFESVAGVQVLRVPDDWPTVQDALDHLGGDGVVEIRDNGRYEEVLAIAIAAGGRIELRAANERRPTLVLRDECVVTGGAGSELRLNGLLITGNRLRVPAGAGPARMDIAHCTLVPGWTLAPDLTPQSPDEASLLAQRMEFSLTLRRCITGALRVPEGASVQATDCIVDATRSDRLALAAPDGGAGAALTLESCTVIGRIAAHTLPLLSNCLLLATPDAADPDVPAVRAELQQQGCVRFTWLPPDSRTPRRHRCLPESAAAAADALPQWSSLRYGEPGYAQLAATSGPRLLTGAEDESEPGAYRHLGNAWRDANLRLRLDEYLRVGLQAGIFHEN